MITSTNIFTWSQKFIWIE